VVADTGWIGLDTLLEESPVDSVGRCGGVDNVNHFFEVLTHDLLKPTPPSAIGCGFDRLVPRRE
jgi:hypothetical protein